MMTIFRVSMHWFKCQSMFKAVSLHCRTRWYESTSLAAASCVWKCVWRGTCICVWRGDACMCVQEPDTNLRLYSLFTLRKACSPLRTNGEQAFLRVDRLYASAKPRGSVGVGGRGLIESINPLPLPPGLTQSRDCHGVFQCGKPESETSFINHATISTIHRDKLIEAYCTI